MVSYDIRTGVKKIKTKTAVSISVITLSIAGLGGSLAFIPALSHAAPPSPNPAGQSAPKATGSVGYTAYTSVQRNADFSAIQGSNSCTNDWNLVGSYVFTLDLGPYAHDINLTSQANGVIAGTGGYPAGPPASYIFHETVTGTVSGNTFSYTSTYTENPSYSYTVIGTINLNGTLVVSSWSDTNNVSSGHWSVTGNASQTASGCNGKGTFHYTDAEGNWYYVDVQYVKVSGNQTWFAGPVTSGNVGAGQWLFAEVKDNGTPGSTGDQIWGSFTTTQGAAQLGVATMSNPGDGPFAVTSGNLMVHN